MKYQAWKNTRMTKADDIWKKQNVFISQNTKPLQKMPREKMDEQNDAFCYQIIPMLVSPLQLAA